MIREVSSAGVSMIMGFESLRLAAYQDERGIWTIGYGHTPSHKGQTITQEEAEGLLDDDLVVAETAVSKVAGTCTDNQYDAMVSLCFNIGGPQFRSSTVLRDHLAGNFAAAGQAFLMWDKVTIDGELVDSAGLLNRRKIEMAMYLNENQNPAGSGIAGA